MGKNKGGGKFAKDREELQEAQRRARDIEKKIAAKCDHHKSNGRLDLTFLGDDMYECNNCGARFSMAKIKDKDIKEAMSTFHNMIHQMRCLSDPDKERDARISGELGVLNLDIKESVTLYHRIVTDKGKFNNDKNKNKNRDRNDDQSYGRFGTIGLSGKGGGGGKKDKGRDRDRDRDDRYAY